MTLYHEFKLVHLLRIKRNWEIQKHSSWQ